MKRQTTEQIATELKLDDALAVVAFEQTHDGEQTVAHVLLRCNCSERLRARPF